MELKGKRIAFLGDSITEGVGASTEDKKYVEVFRRNCGLQCAYNYGISGTRIARQKNPSENPNYDKDFMSRVGDMNGDVDAVVVFGGSNDFGHGDAPLGAMGDQSEYSFYGGCAILMKSLIKKYPNIPIVFLTPMHRADENTPVNEIGLKRAPLCDYVRALKKTAEAFSLPVLDLYAAGGMMPVIGEQNELYFTDGLHPNDAGHEKLARMLEIFMRQLIF